MWGQAARSPQSVLWPLDDLPLTLFSACVKCQLLAGPVGPAVHPINPHVRWCGSMGAPGRQGQVAVRPEPNTCPVGRLCPCARPGHPWDSPCIPPS